MCASIFIKASSYSSAGTPPEDDDLAGKFNLNSSIDPLLSVVSYSFFTGLVPHLAMYRTQTKRFIELFRQSPTFPFITNILLHGKEINLDYIKELIIGETPSSPRIRF